LHCRHAHVDLYWPAESSSSQTTVGLHYRQTAFPVLAFRRAIISPLATMRASAESTRTVLCCASVVSLCFSPAKIALVVVGHQVIRSWFTLPTIPSPQHHPPQL